MSKNIVILGAGFGGIRAALNLARCVPKERHIFLIDRNPYHIYYPRLYELIMPYGGQGCTVDIKEILRGTRVEFVQGEVKGVDCKGGLVQMANGKSLSYDYLVLALGVGTDYFGIEGLEKYACTLKSIEDAGMIREKVTNFLHKIRHPEEPQGDEGSRTNKSGILRVAQNDSNRIEIMIGGAGATGVEVAAELAYLFRRVPRDMWNVTLVEALSAVLWMFPPAIGEYAHRRLTNLGVHTMLDTCIKRVEPAGSHPERSEGSRVFKNDGIPRFARNDGGRIEIVLAPRPLKPGESESALACDFLPEHEKRVRADLLLWAGGIRANPLISQCGLTVDRKGRVEVDEQLQIKGLDGVFAIGDNAALIDPRTNQPVLATAQAAIEQGRLVAKNILHTLQGQTLSPYRFHEFPAIIPLGGHAGVAYVGGRVSTGLPTWFLRKAADWRYFAGILGWWRAIKMIFYQ